MMRKSTEKLHEFKEDKKAHNAIKNAINNSLTSEKKMVEGVIHLDGLTESGDVVRNADQVLFVALQKLIFKFDLTLTEYSFEQVLSQLSKDGDFFVNFTDAVTGQEYHVIAETWFHICSANSKKVNREGHAYLTECGGYPPVLVLGRMNEF